MTKINYPQILNGDQFFYDGVRYFCIESPLNKKESGVFNMVYDLHIIPCNIGRPIKVVNTDPKITF